MRVFVDFATLGLHLDGVVIGEATEDGDLHARDGWRRADDKTFHRDELVCIRTRMLAMVESIY